MKKIILVTVLLGVGVWAQAQNSYSEHTIDTGIRRGDTLFSLFVGGVNPTDSEAFDVNVGGQHERMKWGRGGVAYGASIFYFVHDFIGVGLEVSGANTTYAQAWWGNTSYKTATDLYNGMVVGRINVNPYQPLRVYVPAGVGFAWARNRWRTQAEQEAITEKSFSYGYFVGLGIETNFMGKDKSVGAEVRYNGFGADLDNRVAGADIRGKKQMGYMSILFKMNYRF